MQNHFLFHHFQKKARKQNTYLSYQKERKTTDKTS